MKAILILILVVIYVTSAQRICPRFEFWNQCASACSSDSCLRIAIQDGGACTLQCVQKCVCIRGRFRRVRDGRCVLPQHCWRNGYLGINEDSYLSQENGYYQDNDYQ